MLLGALSHYWKLAVERIADGGTGPRNWAARLGIWAGIPLLVFSGVTLLQRTGVFQPLELHLYDWFIKTRPPVEAHDPRICIVKMTEDDIQKIAYPLPDKLFARLLEIICAQHPRAIGVDIYRDLPEPRNADGRLAPELESVLAAHSNIIWIYQAGVDSSGVKPPPCLINSPDQLGFNDFPLDDKKARRTMLYFNDGTSFALQVALTYLQPLGIDNVTADPGNPGQAMLGRSPLTKVTPNYGGYVNLDASGYQIMLDYAGPRQFDSWSVGDVLAGKTPPDFARGRVVMIGSIAESLGDYQATPLAPDEPGIVVHAQTVNQLIRAALTRDQSVHPWGATRDALWLLLWCAAGTALVSLYRWPLVLAAALLGCGAGLIGGTHHAFLAGIWIPLVPPALGFFGSAGIGIGCMAHHEMRKRGVLMNIFRRNVSEAVASTLWKRREEFAAGGRLRPQSLTATILFTDLRNFSTASENMDPELLMEWLNDYMASMESVIHRHKGVLVQYIGDSIMAVFGAPVPRTTEQELDEDAVNAVRCALGFREELVKFNQRCESRGLPVTGMRVGIFTGPVVSGCLGSPSRLCYTTLGNSTNTASRLESFDKTVADSGPTGCRILVGESTYHRLGDRFQAVDIGIQALKGITGKVRIYQVIDELINQTKHENSNRNRGVDRGALPCDPAGAATS